MQPLAAQDNSWMDFFIRNRILLIVAAILYVIMTVRTALLVRRLGRSPVRWFFISLFFTAIPVGFLFLWHNFGWLLRGQDRPGTGKPDDDGEDENR